KWTGGAKGENKGVLMTVFVQDRQMQIITGYGAEAQLTDAISNRIRTEQVAPAFRKEQYAAGIRAAITTIEATLEGNPPPPRKASKRPRAGVIILVAFLVLIVISRILQNAARAPATLSRRRRIQRLPWWWGGFGGGLGGGGCWGGEVRGRG